MRLAQLQMVARLADARRALLWQIDVLQAKPADASEHVLGKAPFVITIDGERQDDTILELVRPVVIKELRARVRTLDRDLEALGVAVD